MRFQYDRDDAHRLKMAICIHELKMPSEQMSRPKSRWLALGTIMSGARSNLKRGFLIVFSMFFLFLSLSARCGIAQSVATPDSRERDSLLDGFKSPPEAARPRVWWHWMNSNVSREGAALDLAWMQRVGVGGIHVFSGALAEPTLIDPPVTFMSPEWKSIFRDSLGTARKAGMEVTIAGSPGWSETGGPWVTPEEAMKKYVWSDTMIEGGTHFTGKLKSPPSETGPFQQFKRAGPAPIDLTHDVYADAVVLAFPTPAAEFSSLPAKFTSSSRVDLSRLAAGGFDSAVSLDRGPDGKRPWIKADFGRPAPVAAITLGLASRAMLTIQTSDNGVLFHDVLQVPADTAEKPAPEQTISFPCVQSRFIRIVFSPVAPPSLVGFPKPPIPKSVLLTRIALHSGGRVNRFESKAGFTSTVNFSLIRTPRITHDSIVRADQVIDLTNRLHPDGTLDWNPPAGHWTVLRIGYTLTGQTNGPAEESATGLEVDKLDAGLVRKYMEYYLKLYSDAAGAQFGPSGVQNVLTDSWEAGVQNWTPRMIEQFKLRRGYDPTPYLPTLTGWVVNDAKSSDRFLWDFHRTLKEMLADNHYGTLEKVLHEHHMGYYTEAQGDTPRAIGDGFAIKSRADFPTGEFWYRPFATDPGEPPLKADLEESASVAHFYGKKFAAAESLTVAAPSDPWAFSPAMLKPVIDEIFAHGINRILIHESHHQPFVNKAPGFELAIFGQYFNRNDTWAEEAKPWLDYMARSSYMLQQGTYVADVAYFYGEDRNLTELFDQRINTDIPAGYHYDYLNDEALLSLSVKDGKLVTPSGMSYRVLFLPSNVDHFTLSALHKIRHLVAAGAVVVGQRPAGGLGLMDDDHKVESVAARVWGPVTSGSGLHKFGLGRVYTTDDLATVLRSEHVPPDIDVSRPEPDTNIMTLHRHLPTSDIYFVTNQQDRPEDFKATCRVRGMAPELWHAEDGSIEPVSYQPAKDGVSVSLHLDPFESVFLVFHTSSVPSQFVPKTTTTVLETLSGPWEVLFEPGRGAPSSSSFAALGPWNESTDPGIRYFSGHATYMRTIAVPDAWLRKDHRVLLNLGEVQVLAEVSINGSPRQIIWHGPFTSDVTDLLKQGENRLAITVTNLWPNRLVGDKQAGAMQYAFAPQSPYKPNSPLLRSGLIGPVQLIGVSASAQQACEGADLDFLVSCRGTEAIHPSWEQRR
jgi:hypothetical protein